MNYSTPVPFSLSPRSSLQVTVEILVTCSLMVLGACGNMLVFLAVCKDKSLRTIPNEFVVNLAVTDFLFFVVVVPLTTAALMRGEWKLDMCGCKLQGLIFGTDGAERNPCNYDDNRYKSLYHNTAYSQVQKCLHKEKRCLCGSRDLVLRHYSRIATTVRPGRVRV